MLEDMSSAKAADVAEVLDPDTAGRILSEMHPALAASVLGDMEPPEASMVLSAMAPDDAVDVLEHMPASVHDAIVGEMEPEEAEEVRQLEQYPPDTAGGIMTPEVTALAEDLTVETAINELRRLSEELEQMFYVYVVDKRNHLLGVLSMRDLILARPDRRLSQIMHTEVASVPVTMDQEQVARTMRRNSYLAMPVVDARHRLIGLVTADDAARVLEYEATEDVQKMFGAGAEERLLSPWTFSFRKRVWWLEVNLGTAFLAAWVISRFDEVIAALPILAAWQSIVSGMGGNGGAQALAVAIRGIAIGESAPRCSAGCSTANSLSACSRAWPSASPAGLALASDVRLPLPSVHPRLRRIPRPAFQSHQRLRHRRANSIRDEAAAASTPPSPPPSSPPPSPIAAGSSPPCG